MKLKLSDVAARYTYETVLAESTIKSYHSRADLFDRFHSYVSIEELTQQDVLDWRDKLMDENIRYASINNYIRHCKVLWKFAYSQQLVSDQSVFNIKKLPEVKIKRTIMRETIKAALSLVLTYELGWFWSSVITLQARTGIRNRQLRNIKVADIDMKNAVLLCRAEGNKTRTSNELPLSPAVINSLQVYFLQSKHILGRDLFYDEYLFEIARYNNAYKKQPDKRMSANQLQSIYTKLSKILLKSTGERITGHRLRHTLATEIGSRVNVNIRVVQEYFGWSAIQTAQNYVQVGLAQKRELLEGMNDFT